jgi:hypothetical protein
MRPRMDEMSKPKLHEIRTVRESGVHFMYIAKLNGKWTDLAPYGNRIP